MNTAQTVLKSGATTQRIQSVLPWVVGGLALVLVVWVIAKWR
jgi:hypothetical protein